MINQTKYSISSSSFNQITIINNDGGVLFLSFVPFAQISNSEFLNSRAKNGGALYLQSCLQVIIESCIFNDNIAEEKGGAIYSDKSVSTYIDSKIKYNKSVIGGGIYYIYQKPQFKEHKVVRQLQNQELIDGQYSQQVFDNIAEIFGNNLASNLNKIIVKSIKSLDYSKIYQISDTQIEIDDFRSGDSLEFEFFVEDEEGKSIRFQIEKMSFYSKQLQEFISSLNIEIFPENNQRIELSNQIICNFRDFNNTTQIWTSSLLKMINKPSAISVLNIQSPNVANWEGVLYNIKIFIKFRSCAVGEIFGKREDLIECIPCPKGFYSLSLPEQNKLNECFPCPESAYECQKNNIYLKGGYWRSSNDTDEILYCKNNPSNCKGSYEGNINYCIEGHIGSLCESCDSLGKVWNKTYMRRKQLECLSCDKANDYIFIIPLVVIIILLFAYIIISISQAIKMSKGYTYAYYFRKSGMMSMGTSAIKDQTPFYFKQLMHYMQIASLINKHDFDIPDILKFIPQVISLPIENVEYSFDCLINKMNQPIPLIFMRALWSLFIPVIYGVALICIYGTLLLIKRVKHGKFFAFNGLFFMLIFLESNVVSRLVSIISCRKISQKQFTHNDSSYECYTKEHILYSLYIVLPGMLVWIVIIPLIILQSLKKNKNNLDSIFVRFKFGFLYQEFKNQYYYWEFVKSYIKIMIVIMHSFYSDNMQFYSMVICGILLFYSMILTKVSPYLQLRFNKIDFMLTIAIIVLILLNVIIEDTPLYWVQSLGGVLAALLYNSVIIIFIYQILMIKLHVHCFKQLQFIKKFLKVNLSFLFFWISLKKPVNAIRAYKNWKKVRNIVDHKHWLKTDLNQEQNLVNKLNVQFASVNYSSNHLHNHKGKVGEILKRNKNKSKLNNGIYNDLSSKLNLNNSDSNLIEITNIQSPSTKGYRGETKQALNQITTNEINKHYSILSFNLNSKQSVSQQEIAPLPASNGNHYQRQSIKPTLVANQKIIKALESLSDSSETSSLNSQENDEYFYQVKNSYQTDLSGKQNQKINIEKEENINTNKIQCTSLRHFQDNYKSKYQKNWRSSPNLLNINYNQQDNIKNKQLASLDEYVRNRVISKNYSQTQNELSYYNLEGNQSFDGKKPNYLTLPYPNDHTVRQFSRYNSEIKLNPNNNNLHLFDNNSTLQKQSLNRSTGSKKRKISSLIFKQDYQMNDSNIEISNIKKNEFENIKINNCFAQANPNDDIQNLQQSQQIQFNHQLNYDLQTPQNNQRPLSISVTSNQSDQLDLQGSRDGSSHIPIPSLQFEFIKQQSKV